jgi:hypothetical protein
MSTLNEFMLNSPYNSTRLSSTSVKARTMLLLDFDTKIELDNKFFFKPIEILALIFLCL